MDQNLQSWLQNHIFELGGEKHQPKPSEGSAASPRPRRGRAPGPARVPAPWRAVNTASPKAVSQPMGEGPPRRENGGWVCGRRGPRTDRSVCFIASRKIYGRKSARVSIYFQSAWNPMMARNSFRDRKKTQCFEHCFLDTEEDTMFC